VPDFGGKDLEDMRLSNEWESASFTEKREHLVNKKIFEVSFIGKNVRLR
jgi:hypothetical protein